MPLVKSRPYLNWNQWKTAVKNGYDKDQVQIVDPTIDFGDTKLVQIPCPTCWGAGVIYDKNLYEDLYAKVTCPSCIGTRSMYVKGKSEGL